MKWPDFKFPPINLFSLPKRKCKHPHWMMLHSAKKKLCYDCGKEETITNDMPVHQR